MSTPETTNPFASNPPSEEMDSVPPQEPITGSQASETEPEVEEKVPQSEEGEEDDSDSEDESYYPDDEYESQSYASYDDYYDYYAYGLDWNESGYFD